MAFVKAKKQARYGKVSVQGKEKSGKTTTAAELALYVAKKHHPGKPVAFLASEPGIDFVIEFFEKEGVELLEERSRAFVTLKNSIPNALKAGAGVLLIDSATAFWQEAVKAYKKANNINRKLKPFEYTPIKEKWREFTDQFVEAKLDIIVCGRLGFEYEDLEDANGDREMVRSDTKMKTEGDFNYETDLIIEMTSRPDPAAGNAVNIGKAGKKKLARSFKANNIHIATVKGCRVWSLNGQVFEFRAKAGYELGDAGKVGQCFAPYFDFLNSHDGQHNVVDNVDSTAEFQAADGNYTWKQKTIAIEEWDAIFQAMLPGQTAEAKNLRSLIGREIAAGILSRTAFESQSLDDLKFQVLTLNKLWRRAESTPEVLDTKKKGELLDAIDKAHKEAALDWEAMKATGNPQSGAEQVEKEPDPAEVF